MKNPEESWWISTDLFKKSFGTLHYPARKIFPLPKEVVSPPLAFSFHPQTFQLHWLSRCEFLSNQPFDVLTTLGWLSTRKHPMVCSMWGGGRQPSSLYLAVYIFTFPTSVRGEMQETGSAAQAERTPLHWGES